MCIINIIIYKQYTLYRRNGYQYLLCSIPYVHPLSVQLDWQEGSKSSLVVFNFREKTITIGALEPSPVRVLQAETKLDSIELQLDKTFLDAMGSVPGMDHYNSDASEEEGAHGENLNEGGNLDEVENLAANGMEPQEPDLEEALGTMLVEHHPELFAEDDTEEDLFAPDPTVLIPADDVAGDEVEIAVKLDEAGNLIACEEIELVNDIAPQEGGTGQEGWEVICHTDIRSQMQGVYKGMFQIFN